jgi:hypothetical protein
MMQSKAISLIMELTQTFDNKKCENHLDYLIKNKKIPGLKRGGCVVTAQKTTVNHSQIYYSQAAVTLACHHQLHFGKTSLFESACQRI